MNRFPLWIAPGVLSIFPAAPLLSQTPASPEKPSPGASVRITAPRWEWDRSEARFRGLNDDTLILERPGAPNIRMASADVQQLEVRERSNHRTSYALIGAAVGAAVGFVGTKVYLDARYLNDEENVRFALIYGVPIGALLGAAAGGTIGTEQWKVVPLSAAMAIWINSKSTISAGFLLPLSRSAYIQTR